MLGQRPDLAVVDDLDDLALDRLADPGQVLGLALEGELGDETRLLPDERGSVTACKPKATLASRAARPAAVAPDASAMRTQPVRERAGSMGG